jgi:hypothetical protein
MLQLVGLGLVVESRFSWLGPRAAFGRDASAGRSGASALLFKSATDYFRPSKPDLFRVCSLPMQTQNISPSNYHIESLDTCMDH